MKRVKRVIRGSPMSINEANKIFARAVKQGMSDEREAIQQRAHWHKLLKKRKIAA